MATKPAPQPRRPPRRAPPAAGAATANGNGKAPSSSKPTSPVHPSSAAETPERTVKKLRLARALTLPEATPVSEACRRMAARRVDAVLLTDASGMLSGILTAEDIAGRVIAEGLKPDETYMAKVMTRNPVFVMSNSSAIEALQKMVQGKFRHLPVVEHGEVIAMVDIKKFLYDAISRMEKAAEQGSAIAAAMEGVERQWGNDFPGLFALLPLNNIRVYFSNNIEQTYMLRSSLMYTVYQLCFNKVMLYFDSFCLGPHAFMESLRQQMFKPSLSTVITENSCAPVVSPSDPVTLAAKKMREHQVNSVVVMTGNMLLGILTSKDLALRVLAQNLSPDATLVEKAMTANPDCATLDTSILDALHSMQDGKFLHIPVVGRNGQIIACLDALQLIHAAISMVEGASGANDLANSMMQKFWDSALAMHPAEEFDALMSLECWHQTVLTGNMLGTDGEKSSINLLYDDDEGDRVLLTSDSDLTAAIQHAKSAGWKVLRLHMDESQAMPESTVPRANPSTAPSALPSLRFGVVAGAVALASVAVVVYLKRSQL